MTEDNPPAPAPPASPRQVLLGLFILGQIVFLVLANLAALVKQLPSRTDVNARRLADKIVPRFAEHDGHGWSWFSEMEANLNRWIQLTGQLQNWSLFAPAVTDESNFPALLLLADDNALPGWTQEFDPVNGFHVKFDAGPPQILLLSEVEPADIHRFFRGGDFRLRYYEGSFAVRAQPGEGASKDEHARRMNQQVRQLDYDLARAYMKCGSCAGRKNIAARRAPGRSSFCSAATVSMAPTRSRVGTARA
jgi:hypothetical protein